VHVLVTGMSRPVNAFPSQTPAAAPAPAEESEEEDTEESSEDDDDDDILGRDTAVENEFEDGTNWGKYTTLYDDVVDQSKMDLADVDGPSTEVVASCRLTDAQILQVTDFFRSLKVKGLCVRWVLVACCLLLVACCLLLVACVYLACLPACQLLTARAFVLPCGVARRTWEPVVWVCWTSFEWLAGEPSLDRFVRSCTSSFVSRTTLCSSSR
jgi:hypothetical protein